MIVSDRKSARGTWFSELKQRTNAASRTKCVRCSGRGTRKPENATMDRRILPRETLLCLCGRGEALSEPQQQTYCGSDGASPSQSMTYRTGIDPARHHFERLKNDCPSYSMTPLLVPNHIFPFSSSTIFLNAQPPKHSSLPKCSTLSPS